MAVKKQVVSDADKASVLKSFDSSMSPDGLEATQIGWKCNRSGTEWAERVLDVLLSEKRVLKQPLKLNHSGRESYVNLWRLP